MQVTISNKKFGQELFVAASNAYSNNKINSQFQCDNTSDEVQINEAITALGSVGGIVRLTEGTFSLSDAILGAANVTIIGAGKGATKIVQTGSNKKAFDFSTNGQIGLKDLCIQMPTSNSGDAVTVGGDIVDGTSNIIFENLRFQGGTSTSYAIRLTDCFKFSIRNIDEVPNLFRMNGLLIENADNRYNYGNGQVQNIQLALGVSNTKGIYIKGYTGGKTVNLIDFSGINIITGTSTGREGIVLENAHYCSFKMTDLEQLETGIRLNNARYNTFTGPYWYNNTNKVVIENTTTYNTFVGGMSPGTLTGTGNREL